MTGAHATVASSLVLDALGLSLFLAACLGHLVLLIASHNRFWYGSGLHRRIVDVAQWMHALLLVAVPVCFWLAFGLDLPGALSFSPAEPWRLLLSSYLVACWLTAFVLLPANTLRRRLSVRPVPLVSNHTQTVDVVARLGYRPAGQGLARRLACLPGNQVFQVDFSERTLRLPRLPAEWDGLTVLHLTDLHLCGTPDRAFYEQVMDLCTAWEPDLVAVTGDLVDTEQHHRWLLRVLGRLRWRLAAYAILGNHDFWHDPVLTRRRLRRLRMRVLPNTWEQIEVRGRPLVVIGHEGPWTLPEPDLKDCPAGPFRLLLSHTPDNLGWARRHGIDLMLAGHVHGGQIRLPLFGPVVMPSRYGRRYDAGVFDEPPTLLHVSRGLGGEKPLRFNCRPEVTKLVLRCLAGPGERGA